MEHENRLAGYDAELDECLEPLVRALDEISSVTLARAAARSQSRAACAKTEIGRKLASRKADLYISILRHGFGLGENEAARLVDAVTQTVDAFEA